MKKNWFTKFAQKNYITYSLYCRNSLFESAASCSFGFVFSFIPIIMLVLSGLSSVLRKYPEIMNYVLELTKEFNSLFDMTPVIQQFTRKSSFSWMDVVLIIWVIWVARNFFLYVARAMNRIFHSESPQKGYVTQLMTFIGEFSLIIGLILIIIASFLLNRFLKFPLFQALENSRIPFKNGAGLVSAAILYFVLFIFTTLVYRFEPRTAPRTRSCIIFGGVTTIFFMIFSKIINTFMNFSRYNLVYGTISAVILLMFKVFFFFMVFLYFAEYLYVSQNFDSLLFCEIYMLPGIKKSSPFKIRQKLFTNPSVLQNKENTAFYKQGDIIYSPGDKADFVYFLKSGTVVEEKNDIENRYEKGVFFGEKSAVLKRDHLATASAEIDCEIIRIKADEFRALLVQNPRASAHAVEKL
ncbi:MAG: YihY/virulence factor BrkB family protein [Treponema sp.]|nr:YihY/virulence factor BrkB family protein [Treponema sp.]